MLFLFLSFFVGVADAQVKPVCNSAVVHQNCEFYRKNMDKAQFTLPDGSVFYNPLTTNGQPLLQTIPPTPSQYGGPGYANQNDILYQQAEVLKYLEGTNLSARFKVSLSQLQSYFSLEDTEQTLVVAWPENDPDGVLTEVPASQVIAKLKANLPADQYAKLDQFLKERQKAIAASLDAEREKWAQQRATDFAREDLEKEKAFKRQQKLQRLFKYAQDAVKEAIEQKRKMKPLSPQQEEYYKNLLKRVETLTPLDSESALTQDYCKTQGSMAAYKPLNHSISVCDATLDLPEAQIVTALGHEIGHSIDTCYSQMPLLKIDKEKIQTFLNQSSNISKYDRMSLQYLINSHTNYSAYDLDLFFDSIALSKELHKKNITSEVIFTTPLSQYPFLSEANCLKKAYGLQSTAGKDIQELHSFLSQEAKKELNPEKRKALQKSIERYKTAQEKYPQCFKSLKGDSQLGEGMGDIMGTVTLNKYLRENIPTTEIAKAGSILFSDDWCKPYLEDSAPPIAVNASLVKPESNSHVPYSFRVSNFYLNLPSTAGIFNCQRKQPACFDHLELSTGSKGINSKKEKAQE